MKDLSLKHFAIVTASLLASPAMAEQPTAQAEDADISTCKGYATVLGRDGKEHQVLIESNWQRINKEIWQIMGAPKDTACSYEEVTLENGTTATIAASNPTGAYLIANHYKANQDGHKPAKASQTRPASPGSFVARYSPE